MIINAERRMPSAGWTTVTAASLFALLSPLLWPGLIQNLLASGYMPHGHCYFWTPSLVRLHLITDSFIGTSYVAISASFIYLVHRTRRDIPFHWIILVFGAFIVACGATHFMDVWTLWNATYWLAGAVKMIAAIASVAAAVAVPLVIIPGMRRLLADARLSRERQESLRLAHLELQAAYDHQRQIDQRFRREHRYVKTLLSNLHEQVIVCDLDGTVMFTSSGADSANDGGDGSYPTLPEIIADVEMADAVSGRPLTTAERPIQRALRGEAIQDVPLRFRRRGGDWRFGIAVARPIVDADGQPIGAMGVIRDVTEERLADDAISALQRRNESILRAAGEGICGIDRFGRTTLMNPAAERISGWRLEQLAGHVRHAMVHHTRSDGTPYPWIECPEFLTLRDGRPRKVSDDVFWRPDGTWFPVEFHVTPIQENDTITGAVVTFQDISERKRLEQDLEQARRVESLGRLAATIAHEFNNVLMGIQPFVEIIGARAPDQSDIRKSLNYISFAVQRGKRVSHEILRFTQPAEPVFEKIDVRTWADELVEQTKPILGPRVRLVVDVAMEVEGMLGDSAQLHQVFLNLFLNARDAMPSGGTIHFSAISTDETAPFPLGTAVRGEFVHFIVSDTGRGIAPEVMKHLFEPLFTTKKSGGTGLGLALVHQVITRHGGHVFAESRLGEGATFHVYVRKSDAPPPAFVGSGSRGSLAGRRILLVEDEQAVSAGIEILLEIEGMVVHMVNCGKDTIDAVTHFAPDVVVLDVGLPDVPGDVVYREMARRWPDLPVIFSTGHADRTKLTEHLTHPNVKFLTKPYEARDLILFIEELLNEDGASNARSKAAAPGAPGDRQE